MMCKFEPSKLKFEILIVLVCIVRVISRLNFRCHGYRIAICSFKKTCIQEIFINLLQIYGLVHKSPDINWIVHFL